MQDLASTKPLHPAMARHLDAAVTEAVSIYDRLYPDQNLRIIFREGSDPTWGEPEVKFGPFTFGPADLGPEYIGQICRTAERPGSPDVTVLLAIPPSPTPAEARGLEAPWHAHRLQALFALKPMLYEQVRYLVEMRRKRAVFARHSHAPLPLGKGSAALAPVRTGPDATSARPSVVIGFHWLEVGGAEKLAFDAVHWALAAGLRVFVLASTRSLHLLADRLPNHPDVTFIRLDLYLPDNLWPQFVSRLIEAENVRLVHIHHCQKLYDCLPQIKACHPWVQVVDSTHIVEHADGGYPRVSGVWSDYIDVHHVISHDLARYYRHIFRVLDKVRLGRMLARPPAGTPKELPALNMKAGQKTLHVTFVGRLYYQKRPVVVIETLRALARWAEGAGVTLTGSFVGEGPFETAVRALLRRYRLADQIEMLPANANVPALLAKSDVMLLPSNNEGLALVCYEAVERGCIPISTDVGAQREIVPPGLRVPLAPFAAVKQSVAIVDRLWRSPEALAEEQAALHQAWRNLENDPTAEELLMPMYRAAFKAGANAQE